MTEEAPRTAEWAGRGGGAPGDGSHGAAAGASGAEAGLTLIEVLVAIMILAVGLLAVAGMAGAVASHTQMGGNLTGQAAAGQEVLEEFQMKGFGHTDLAVGSTGTRKVVVSSMIYTVTYRVNSTAWADLKEVVAVVEGTRELPPDTLRTMVARMGSPAPLP